MIKIIGHEELRAQLSKRWEQQRLPQSLLLSGPEAIGKYLVANELVGNILSFTKQQYQSGEHPDLLTLGRDEAGLGDPLKVEQVRDLKHFFQTTPYQSDYKVAIIRDAHRLTVQAQNALLKILEEPPSYAYLLLTSHEPQSLLTTVRSRLQTYSFAPLSNQAIKETMKFAEASLTDFLMERYPGQIGLIRRFEDQEKQQQLQQHLKSLSLLSHKPFFQRLAWVHELKIQDAQHYRELVSDLIAWYRWQWKRQKQLTTKESEKWAMLRVYVEDLVEWKQRIKSGMNYQLQFERLLFRIPHVF